MATEAENIATIRANALAELASMSADPKPSYSVGGRSFDWNGYREHLMRIIEWTDSRSSVGEVISEGYSA